MSNKWIFSASEIDTFLTCRKKWALRYLDGIEAKPSKAAELGSSVHRFLENYLIGNKINYETDEGTIAKPGLMFLPQSLPQELVEKQVMFSKAGFLFQGYIDFLQDLGDQRWLVGDHKTCSSLTYALSAEELKKNTQANIYAQWVFLEKGAKEIVLKWVYYRTKSKPQSRCVEAKLTPDEADKNFEKIIKTTEEITKIISSKTKSTSLPKNQSACFKYGPCPFFAQCQPKTIDFKVKDLEKLDLPKPFSENKVSAFHLYIDCAPVKSETSYENTIELSDLLKPVLKKIKEEKELSHYRLAGYGQHVGLIANYLGEHLKANAYNSRTAILSSSKTPEGCDTLQTLSAAAGHVVRGF